MFNPENVTPHTDPKPFLIYIRHRDQQRDVSWRPDAFVGISRGLRTSGFLAAVPAEELKSLLYLLSFVTANGNVGASALQLAEAFHLSQTKTHRRMERLVQMMWADEPIVHYRRFESGLDAFVPQTGLFSVEEESNAVAAPSEPAYRAASREAVIAHSRRMYTRPRAEVEEIVLSQLRPLNQPINQPLNAKEIAPVQFSAEQKPIGEALQSLSMTAEQITSLLSRFDLPRIKRQIMWLPHRRVKNPAGFLIAAIEHDYEAPRGMAQQSAVADPDDSTPQTLTP